MKKSGNLASTFDNIHLAGMEAEDTDGGGSEGEGGGGGKTVIFKTLAILAIACLVSILFLLLLSITFSRISWPFKSNSIPISIARRKWDKRKGEEEQVVVCDYHTHHSSCSNNTESSYQNLNPSSAPATTTTTTHRGPTGRSYTRLPDQDTVELSGITNRLYFENEDIYHIT